MLAGGAELPIIGRWNSFCLEGVGQRVTREQTPAIHPRAKIGRDRDVGRRGDDMRGEFAILARDLIQNLAEAHLRRDDFSGVRRNRELVRHSYAGCGMPPRSFCEERRGMNEGVEPLFTQCRALPLVPLMTGTNANAVLKSCQLRRRHQPCMVVLMACERQAEALDGVTDETCRSVMLRCRLESFQKTRHFVSAEIVHQRRQFGIATTIDQGTDRTLITDLVEQFLPPRSTALKGQRRIMLVRTTVDPVAQHLATGLGECLLL